MHPVDDAFVNGPDSNDGPKISYVPIGPHDLFLPDQDGPNIRAITDPETSLFDENTVLSIFNDGQIDIDESVYLLNTPLYGPGVAPGTLVIGITFGNSRPNGTYSAVFLKLSRPLDNANGPFVWQWTAYDALATGPTKAVFQNGTPFHCTTILNKLQPWDTTLQLSAIAPTLAAQLTDALYETMSHFYVQTTDATKISNGSYFPSVWTFPSDALPGQTDTGPSYLSQIWPSSVPSAGEGTAELALDTSTLSVRAFIKPMSAPPQLSLSKHSESFAFTGSIQTFDVPPFIKSITVRAFGAGGNSVEVPSQISVGATKSKLSIGSDGSFAIGTFDNLAGQRLKVYVGQGGGKVPAISPLCGGLNGNRTGGGGLSGISIGDSWLLVAGGGGQGSITESAKGETEDDSSPWSGKSGVLKTQRGQLAFNSSTGAGGSGFYGGATGMPNYAGGSGSSLVPIGGSIYGNIERQKYWSSGIGKGSSVFGGDGLLVIDMTF
jgi:hypothetical protein